MSNSPELLLLTVLLSLIAAFGVGGFLLRNHPGFPWAPAWVVALVAAFCFRLDETHALLEPLGSLSGSLYPVLFVAGALSYAGLPQKTWLLGAGLAIGAARALLVSVGLDAGAYGLALATSPAILLFAAVVVQRHVAGTAAPALQHFIPIGFVALACLEVLHSVLRLGAGDPDALLPFGVAVGVLVAATQIVALFERIGRERAGALRDLDDNERRFVAISEGVYDLLFEFDGAARLVYASAGGETALGLRPGEAIGRDGRDLVHPEDRPLLERSIVELRSNVQLRLPLLRVRHADGSWRWLESTVRIYPRASGDVRALLVSRDVTARHEAEEALRATQERLRAVLSSMGPLRAVVVDEDGRLQSIFGAPPAPNEALYGMRRDEASRQSIGDFLPEDAARAMLDRIRRVFKTGEPCEVTQRVELPNGVFQFRGWIHPLRTNGGEVQVALAITRDVTEELAQDDERRRREAQAERARRHESLERLAGGMAHDFNNFLMAISGNTDLILDRLSHDAALRPQLEEIRDASGSASRLTTQLLAYLGQTAYPERPLDLSDLVERAAERLRQDLPRNVRLVVHPGAPCPVLGDETALDRVVASLVTNAAESIGGAGSIEVRTGVMHLDSGRLADSATTEELPEGEFAFVEVRDDGRGIGEEQRARLFEPFFTTGHRRDGIGLAEVFGIARGHRGTVEVESERDAGTTFRFFVPRS